MQRTAGYISTENHTGSISLHRHISSSEKKKKLQIVLLVFFPHNNNFIEGKKQSGNTVPLLFLSGRSFLKLSIFRSILSFNNLKVDLEFD